MSAADNLRVARALIEDPKHWTQGACGRDVWGDDLQSNELERAICYCSLGAVIKIQSAFMSDEEEFLREAVKNITGNSDGIVDFNDDPDRTHAEVLAAFDKAIELAEKQP